MTAENTGIKENRHCCHRGYKTLMEKEAEANACLDTEGTAHEASTLWVHFPLLLIGSLLPGAEPCRPFKHTQLFSLPFEISSSNSICRHPASPHVCLGDRLYSCFYFCSYYMMQTVILLFVPFPKKGISTGLSPPWSQEATHPSVSFDYRKIVMRPLKLPVATAKWMQCQEDVFQNFVTSVCFHSRLENQ